MMSFWVMLDDSINTDELLADAGAAALAAFFAELVTYQAATRFRCGSSGSSRRSACTARSSATW
jgi:hypothetical protein